MSNDLKEKMRDWVNLPPDGVERTFVEYTSFAKRNARVFYNDFFNLLCQHADQQDMMLKRISDMNDAAMNQPMFHKSNIPTPHEQFNRAIELLEACSEDLFITGDDKELETQVDVFLKENKT